MAGSSKSAPGLATETLGLGSQTLTPDEEERRKKLLEQMQKQSGGFASSVLLGQGGLDASS